MAARVLGVLAGGDSDLRALALWAGSADVLIAADGGADALLAAGFRPHDIVGDLDSATAAALACGARLHRDLDSNRTDCDKLFAFVQEEGYDAVTVAGVEGDRFDHVLASLFSAASSTVKVRWVFRNSLGWIVRAGERVVVATTGQAVSLMPIGGPCRASLDGVRWPLVEAELGVGKLWSVSNTAVGPEVCAEAYEGVALLQIAVPMSEQPLW